MSARRRTSETQVREPSIPCEKSKALTDSTLDDPPQVQALTPTDRASLHRERIRLAWLRYELRAKR